MNTTKHKVLLVLIAAAALLVPGCYMDAESDPELGADSAEVVADTEGAEGAELMSLSEDPATDEYGTEDYETEGFCDIVGQRCSTMLDCDYLEQCINGRCRCECNQGASCSNGNQCGSLGRCMEGRCICL